MANPAAMQAFSTLISTGAQMYASQTGKGIKTPKTAAPAMDSEQQRLAAVRRQQQMATRGRAGTVLTAGKDTLG